MEVIVWSEDYAIGVEIIDEQHKKLVALINRLHEVTQGGSNDHAVGAALVDMVDYAKVHFHTEEGVMRASDYPEFQKHILLHEYFVNRVKVFAKGFIGGDPKVAQEMLSFLNLWLVDHICHADRSFAPFVRGAGESS